MNNFQNRYQNSNYQPADTAHGARALIAHKPQGDTEIGLCELLEIHDMRTTDRLSWDEIAASLGRPERQIKQQYFEGCRRALL